MSSGVTMKFVGSFVGAAADIDVEKVPFQPKTIKFWFTGGGWGLKMADEVGMDGANYLSSTAADVGVTINADGFTVANGADVNSSGNPVYYECEG